MQQKLILFDIDGTLLYAPSKKLRERFTYAMEKVYGISTDVDWHTVEGHTDTTLFLHSLQTLGLSRDEILQKLPQAFEHTYEHFAANVTEEYATSILPGAVEILTVLKNKVHLGILTGNYEKVAWHKLEMVGLRHFFNFGLFGHEAEDRPSLAKLVHAKAKHHFGIDFPAHDIYFIGDTPKDIACARAVHGKVIAVPTGRYTKEELEAEKPDLLIDSLTDPRLVQFIIK